MKPDFAIDRAAAAALLEWYMLAGVDEAMAETPVDRLTPISSGSPVAAPPPAPSRPDRGSPDHPSLAVPAALAHPDAAAARSLEDLRRALASLEDFPLKVTATNLVFGEGVERPEVMFVGEAPGADEDREGRPFCGASGRLLDRMMASIGLSRQSSAYVTNILPWRPPGNREPTQAEIATCLPFVRRHIELVRPRLLVAVGGTSAKTLLDRPDGIMKLRGRVLEYRSDGLPAPIPFVAIFHPAFLLRSPAQKALAWRDLLLIKRKLSTN